ncbi:MAG: hypothetical protein R2824_05010 [Saprospiraceae bacterium]
MSDNALPKLFYRELQKAITAEALSPEGKIEALYRLLNLRSWKRPGRRSCILPHFSPGSLTPGHKYQLNRRVAHVHQFRKRAPTGRWRTNGRIAPVRVPKVPGNCIEAIFDEPPAAEIAELIPAGGRCRL